MRTDRDAVGDRGGAELVDRSGLGAVVGGEPGALGITLEQTAALEQAADAMGEGAAGQRVELTARRRADPEKAQRAVGALDVDAVEKEHVEVHVQVQTCTAGWGVVAKANVVYPGPYQSAWMSTSRMPMAPNAAHSRSFGPTRPR